MNKEKCTVPIFNASAKDRCIPLLKTLLSSHCSNDCKFCALRCDRKTRRERWEPNELAKVAMKLWKMHRIQGVFLSSAVDKDPDFVVEKEIETIRILRNRGFKAYCHLRLMPSVSKDLIKQAVQLADRVGINLEFPSAEHYNDMKIFLNFKQDIIKRIRLLAREIKKAQEHGKCKAGLDSQMIVGASNETDKEILKATEWMYDKLKARRCYFSAFQPIKDTPLENKKEENLWREYRLYQASFLLRDYKYKHNDFVFEESGNLPLNIDPKTAIALSIEMSHIDVNLASYDELIRVPGIGPLTAKNIIEKRKINKIKNVKELKSVGVITNKALPFVGIDGKKQKRIFDYFSKTFT